MKVYFLRRLLLVPLTVLGVTFLVFAITRVMPGSPLERELQAAAAGTSEGGGGGGSGGQSGALSEEQIESFEREYLYDKNVVVAYMTWLGLYPRERLYSEAEFKPAKQGGQLSEEIIGGSYVEDPDTQVEVSLAGIGRPVLVQRKDGEIEWAKYIERSKPRDKWKDITEDGWEYRYETAQERFEVHKKREGGRRSGLSKITCRASLFTSPVFQVSFRVIWVNLRFLGSRFLI